MSDCKIADSHLLEYWKEIWGKWPKEFSRAMWQESSWRQPFELLSAALIYSYNGFIKFPECRLHLPIRPASDWDSVWRSALSSRRPPSFKSQEGQELFATMHFASSSFRICTALSLITKHVTEHVRGPLTPFLKPDGSDWKRSELKIYLKRASSLGCCRTSKTAVCNQIALAMIVAHRDEFGHGEEGQGDEWRKMRGEYFRALHPCRIFQAQLLLIDLGRCELDKIAKSE